jgi:CRP-like cAMP-binding protein
MPNDSELVDTLAGFALFADLDLAALERVAHMAEEVVFPAGTKVIRQGLTGSGLHVILEGAATVVIDGHERARFGPGDFFGEISVLLGIAPVADIVADQQLRALVLAGPETEAFLLSNPPVMYRMLQAMARRLRAANRWSG